jgi:hypothetical protein
MTARMLEELGEDLATEKASRNFLGLSDFEEFAAGPKVPLEDFRPENDQIYIKPALDHEEVAYSVSETIQEGDVEEFEDFRPLTPLVHQLLQIRRRAIRKGLKLLSVEEVLEEVRRRRGEIPTDETDVSGH